MIAASKGIAYVHTAAYGDAAGWLCDGYALHVAGEEHSTIHRSGQDLLTHLATYARPLRLYSHGDRFVIQILADGVEDVRFVSARRSELVCAYVGGHEWVNCQPLLGGATVGQLRQAAPDYHAARDPDEVVTECLHGLVEVASRIHAITGVNPLVAVQRTAAGIADVWLQRVIGVRPTDHAAQSAHRGGRAEVYRLGACGDAVHVDVNSSYAAAFVDTPGPRDDLLCVDLAVPLDQNVPPAFDSTNKGRLVFPVGRVRTWIAQSHLDRYVPATVLRIHERHTVDLTWIREAAPLIRAIYRGRIDARARGDHASALACKALLTGSYGRLAVTGNLEMAVWRRSEPRNGVFYRLPRQNRILVFTHARMPAKNVNYPLAAWVADNARARLFAALDRTPAPLYCATDAVMAGALPPVQIGEGLGEWKLEGSGPLSVRGLHNYTHGSDRRRSGGDTMAPRTLRSYCQHPEGVERVVRDETGIYEGRRILSDGMTVPWQNT